MVMGTSSELTSRLASGNSLIKPQVLLRKRRRGGQASPQRSSKKIQALLVETDRKVWKISLPWELRDGNHRGRSMNTHLPCG